LFEKLIIFLSSIDCNKKNPIDYDILLRLPGQSLDEELDDIREKIIFSYIKALFIFVLGILIIVIFKLNVIYEFLMIIPFFIYLIYILVSNMKTIRNYKLGRDGERSVAQYLSIIARQLSKEDANMHIYHDLLNKNKGFNIDHVVVTKKGIFIFETKTYRKEKGKNIIRSNGKVLYRNDQKLTKDIPLQVKGQVAWLQSELHQQLGKKYSIIPSIVFVGWYVEGEKIDGIHITTAKTIKNIIENQYRDIVYDDEELKRITSIIHKLAIVTKDNHLDICK
jgi:hypothetical protein